MTNVMHYEQRLFGGAPPQVTSPRPASPRQRRRTGRRWSIPESERRRAREHIAQMRIRLAAVSAERLREVG